MNELTFRFRKYIEERKKIDLNDDFSIYTKWDELTKMLSENIVETISLLDRATEDEVLWASEVFEDIVFRTKNIEFIRCLENLERKFPSLKKGNIVEIAKRYF